MSRRGRRAVLPPAEFSAVPPLAANGMVVTIVNKAGHGKDFNFSDLPVPEPMQRSLAAVFAAQQARWTSHYSATSAWNRLKVFADFVSVLDSPPEDLTGLDAAAFKRWRLQNISSNTGRTTLRVVHRMLRSDPRLAEGPVAEELARRIPAPKPVRESYDEAEREHVLLTAGRQFRTAWLRIRENTELLERWRAGTLKEGSREWRLGETLDHVARVGDVPRTRLPSGRMAVTNRALLGGRGAEHTWGRLFLTPSELTALAVLLTDRFGWNLSVYDRMPAPSRAPSAAETTSVTYQVQVEKRRAGSGRWFSTENITDSGADSPGRLITQALQATLHGRLLAAQLAPGTDLLMTSRSVRLGRERKDMDRPSTIGPLVFGVSGVDGKSWASEHKLSGSPFRQIRRTTVTREGKPLQQTQGTHESVYVLPDQKVRQASQEIFEAGALEALDQAKKVFFGGHLTQKPDPAHGQTATADCADETTTAWPAPDGGCGADFLLCLACPNAHVHPGHHPRLAFLHEQIQSLRSAIPERRWHQRWHDHWQRLEDLADKIGRSAWAAARTRVNATDRALADLLLKGQLNP
ncbi:hypothetical protein [Streptomyces sp. BK340]|uniref:hypothetical protein n=1 Tax=Streptomyces sp. BK340 TaxID=2572903 RepID=UPI00119DF1C2|nr:hypothetical protein [Streptomyces sp. BK340]TVZ80075.1 hypothetical protein FB157_130122 [Streptomyces sp. BK340]